MGTSHTWLSEPSLSTKQGPHEGDDTVTVLEQDKLIPESQKGKSICIVHLFVVALEITLVS